MGNALIASLSFIISVFFNLYAMLLAVRFVMQLFRADYYNPLAQFVVKVTDPVLKPVRRIVPSIKTYDTSSLLLAFLVLLIKLLLLKTLSNEAVQVASSFFSLQNFSYATMLLLAFVEVIHLLFSIFIYAMIIQAILSWFPNPATDSIRNLLMGITEPLLRPIRKYVRPIGGLDLSVFIGIVALFALRMAVTGSLMSPFLR